MPRQCPPESVRTTPPGALQAFLVEDSAAVRALIIENLSDIPGLVFAGFADAEADALACLRAQRYDIVIFDIELRQGNGISLLRSLAATETLPESLKVIFSNNVSTAYRRVAEQYGVQHFFDKSSDLPMLHALLSQVSAQHRCT